MHTTKKICGTRISRRTFTAMCQIALVPTAWFTLDCFGSMVNRSLDYLKLPDRDEDDAFDLHYRGNVGVTALVTTAVLRGGKSASNPTAPKGLKHLEGFVQSDGGIYTSGRRLENYETCLAAMCFAEANAEHRYDAILRNATAFIKTCQWDESRGKGEADMVYGGAGYGPERRPDLSNTAFLLDAIQYCRGLPQLPPGTNGTVSLVSREEDRGSDGRLSAKQVSLPKNRPVPDPSIKKALVFVSRCQNVDGTSDGGFHYCASGNLRSCGVMTMSGLKSLLHAGIAKNDTRVKAAVAWIHKNYDMTSNPGMGSAGLYHYYHACAETLLALGMDDIEDAAGVKHNWRNDLCTEIVHRQRKDGSWCNENGCWMENDPHIATAHALLALSYCQQPSEKTA